MTRVACIQVWNKQIIQHVCKYSALKTLQISSETLPRLNLVLHSYPGFAQSGQINKLYHCKKSCSSNTYQWTSVPIIIAIIVMITQPRNDSLKQFNISIHPRATLFIAKGEAMLTFMQIMWCGNLDMYNHVKCLKHLKCNYCAPMHK